VTCAWKQKGRQAGLSSVSSGKREENVGLGPRRQRNEGKERGKEKRERGPGLSKPLGQA